MRMLVGRVLVSAVVVGAVVSGCGGPIQAGSAVIIGDSAIPLGTFQPQLDTALRSDAAQMFVANGVSNSLVAQVFVSQTITHELTVKQAAAMGVSASDAATDSLIESAGGLDTVAKQLYILGGPADVHDAVRDYLLRSEIGKKVLPGLSVVTDEVSASNRADAERIARALANGGPAADQVLADPRTAKRNVTTTAATDPDAAALAPFGVPVGSVIAYQPDSQQAGWSVARVVDRRTDAPVVPGAADQLSLAQLAGIGQRYLQLVADQEGGIRLNPRYGVWDQIAMHAVPTAGDVTGEVIAAASPA